MALDKKQLLIFGGGALVVGVAAMYAIKRSAPTSAAGTQPQATPANSMGVPSMPVASIQPAPINIDETPYYQTVNITPPPIRNQIPKQKSCPPKDDCGCSGGFGPGAVMSDSQLTAYVTNTRPAFSSVVQPPPVVPPSIWDMNPLHIE